ncbi:MAG: discoidin domain-containing protein [Mesorhizobium sp.]|nr:MAG: discoidin domain-containing protein [Mesorhizobium sp.]
MFRSSHLIGFGARAVAVGGGGPTPILTPSYWNLGGYGDRTSMITVTTTATLGGGTISNLIDGGYTVDNNDACFWDGGQSTREVKFDFGAGVTKVITGFRWAQSTGNSHGTWVLEGSNDDSSYTGIGSSFTLGGDTLVDYQFSNSTAYRFYKLRQTAGSTSGSPYLLEIEFRIGDPTGSTRDALEAGDRTASITSTTTASLGGGTIANLIDGAFASNGTDALWFTNGQATKEIKFDLGSTKVITGFIWVQGSGGSHGTWIIEGSNDDSSYTQLGSDFTLGGVTNSPNPQHQTFANSTAYRYYKLRQTSGTTSSGPWILELEFRIAS